MLAALFFLAMTLGADPRPLPESPPAANVIKGPADQQSDAQQIAALLAQQYAAWNARDLDGYMRVFWRSPLLVYITEGAVYTGWDQVRANIQRDYPDKNAMGNAVLERLQTNVISSGTALTIEWWTVYFRAAKVRGVTSSTWCKFPEGWCVIHVHTAALDAP